MKSRTYRKKSGDVIIKPDFLCAAWAYYCMIRYSQLMAKVTVMAPNFNFCHFYEQPATKLFPKFKIGRPEEVLMLCFL